MISPSSRDSVGQICLHYNEPLIHNILNLLHSSILNYDTYLTLIDMMQTADFFSGDNPEGIEARNEVFLIGSISFKSDFFCE